MLPFALAVRVDELPRHTVAGLADAVTVPTAGLLTVTTAFPVKSDAEHPEASVSAVNVYVVVVVGETDTVAGLLFAVPLVPSLNV